MNRFSLAIAAALATTALTLPAFAQGGHAAMGHSTEAMNPASQAYMDAMKTMDDAMATMKMANKPGIDFAEMMIPHHQSAIDMAKAYLESGENDPEITKLSNEIIAAQETEIAFLKSWLAKQPE